MLTIRANQFTVLENDRFREFADEIADDLFRSIPTAVTGLSWTAVARRCRTALNVAKGTWGLTHHADLYGFVILSFLLGPELYDSTAIRSILNESGVPDGRKMSVVADAMLQSVQRRTITR